MKVAVLGRGLIGGSIEKSALRAGHEAVVFRGRGPVPDLHGFDLVFLAVPPSAVPVLVDALDAKGALGDGAIVVDIAGVKRPIADALAKYAGRRPWHFVPGHPMAGKEKTGYDNSTATLFDGASMILTPFEGTPPEVLSTLDGFLRSLGFGRVVTTDPAHHDEMIAYTSQLAHVVSSAYVRDQLAASNAGFSAGSYQDMTRVATVDPDIWTDLFLSDSEPLDAVLGRLIARLGEYRDAIRSADALRLRALLAAGRTAKERAR